MIESPPITRDDGHDTRCAALRRISQPGAARMKLILAMVLTALCFASVTAHAAKPPAIRHTPWVGLFSTTNPGPAGPR